MPAQKWSVLEFLNNLPSRNRVIVPARQATQPGGIGSLESILGLLKSLKIWALVWWLSLRDPEKKWSADFVPQIPCWYKWSAEPGCRQWLTGLAGSVQSFNYANSINPQFIGGEHK